MTNNKLEDAAGLATAYLPLIIMAVSDAGDSQRSDEARKHDIEEALKMLEKVQLALYEAGA